MLRWLPLLLIIPAFANAAAPKASSALAVPDTKRLADAELAFDGDLLTAWVHGADGTGAGEWVELTLDKPVTLTSVSVWPGEYGPPRLSPAESSRPKAIRLQVGEGAAAVEKIAVFEDPAVAHRYRFDVVLDAPVTTKRVRILVDSVYEGTLRSNCAISEIALNYTEGGDPAITERMTQWGAGGEGQRKREADRQKAMKYFEDLSAAPELAESAQRALEVMAVNGAPALGEVARRMVPLGFRLSATEPEDTAISAILKAKDPNSMFALELAATRMRGKEAATLQDKIQYFYAWHELQTQANQQVPAWGATGWVKGALRSFGEPLAVEVDSQGTVFVADLGNHRIQRFGADGLSMGAIGSSDPQVSNAWITGRRPWFVAGSEEGAQNGAFTLPLDIEILPNKRGDQLAVLDVKGRVSILGVDGSVQHSWTYPVARPLEEGVGGQAYLERVGKNLVVIWRDQGVLYSLSGEELRRFTLEDGAPSAAEGLPNGQLLLGYGPDMIAYSTDGFRHGRINGDELGEGYESWDLALDEANTLWVLTDNGTLVRYKKPGKPEFTMQIPNASFSVPRLAVRGGVVYWVEGDHVQQVNTAPTP